MSRESIENRMAVVISFTALHANGTRAPVGCPVPGETPVPIEYDGIGYAVLMASDGDLDDLLPGFSLAERIADRADQIWGRTRIAPIGVSFCAPAWPKTAQRECWSARGIGYRNRCGLLCGVENLEQVLRALPRLPDRPQPPPEALFRAIADLATHQPLNRDTGAVHAAAHCATDSEILTVREDVGRHNTFDKLIGAMARTGASWNAGRTEVSRC